MHWRCQPWSYQIPYQTFSQAHSFRISQSIQPTGEIHQELNPFYFSCAVVAAVAAAEGAPSLKPSSHSDKAYLPQHFLAEPTLPSDHAAAAFETVSVEAPKGLHNGGNDSYIRQLQLWDQIICQTKTAKKFLWNWLVILMPCNSLTFEYEEAFAKNQNCWNARHHNPLLNTNHT